MYSDPMTIRHMDLSSLSWVVEAPIDKRLPNLREGGKETKKKKKKKMPRDTEFQINKDNIEYKYVHVVFGTYLYYKIFFI